MNKWDKRYLQMAKLVGSWSKDPSTKVGAVIVDPSNRYVSSGYNGFPKWFDDSKYVTEGRDYKLSYTVHAEMNAIISARGVDLANCTLYTTPLPPCSNCLAMIKQTGISRIVAIKPSDELNERWNIDRVLEVAKGLGILVELIEEEEFENV